MSAYEKEKNAASTFLRMSVSSDLNIQSYAQGREPKDRQGDPTCAFFSQLSVLEEKTYALVRFNVSP